jgi:uncharacterized BrkB/YihY/UPF0761 family membrane protein
VDPAPTEPTTDDDAAPPDATGVAALRGRATHLTHRGKRLVDETRSTVPPVDIGFSAVERDNRIGGFLLAGAIAFRLFVFILPMYLLALVIAGAIFAYDPDQTKDVADSAGMSKYMASSIGDAAQTSHKSLWLLIPVTLYALISAGRSVEKAIAAAHARAWDIPLPKRRPHYVVLGVLGFALSTLTATRIVSLIRHGALVPVSMALGAGIFFGLWLLASLTLPRRPGVSWMSLLPGAILMGAGTQALYLFNVLYLNHKIQSASAAYGALGVAASALLWLYLLGRLMVASPVLNATIWHRHHDPEGGLPPGDRDDADLPELALRAEAPSSAS